MGSFSMNTVSRNVQQLLAPRASRPLTPADIQVGHLHRIYLALGLKQILSIIST